MTELTTDESIDLHERFARIEFRLKRGASRVHLDGLLVALSALAIAGCAQSTTPCAGALCGPDGSVTDGSVVMLSDGAISWPDASFEACDGGFCGVASCAELGCGAHRSCELTSLGPICLDECDPGYDFDPDAGACDPCSGPGCGGTTSPTCDPDVAGSIAAECAGDNRTCVTDASGATCGDCLMGFQLDGASCVPDGQCTGDTCSGDALCQPGFALDSGGVCRTCSDLTCGGATGETGVHDQRDVTDQCICDAADGYYWAPTERLALPCDEDGDGWISRSAWNAVSRAEIDPAVADVAQACTVEWADRVVLANEYGQRLTILLCKEGFVPEAEAGTSGCTPEPLPLVEEDRNDSDLKLAARENVTKVPLYGARRLLARELNGLTKACVSPTGDFDASGVADIAQAQALSMPGELLARWSAFSYFTEIQTSRYDADERELVIEERSRCTDGETAAELPLGYAEGAGTYFRECARRRDARYDAASGAPGFDFAQWSCDADEGSCPVPALPLSGTIGVDVAQQDIPAHGLCNSALDWESAGFMGMQHHSQFKCVLVSSEDEAEREAFERPQDAFHYRVPDQDPPTFTSGYLDFQTCQAATATASDDPTFTCTVTESSAPSFGQVGWAAVRYSDTTAYEGASDLAPLPGEPVPTLREVAGCIDEYEWVGLCSPEAFAARAGRNPLYGDWDDFGALLHCGPVQYVWAADTDPGPTLPEPEKYLYWAGEVGGALWE